METWLILAVLSYLSYAISTSIDKYFMKNGHDPVCTNTFKMFFDGAILLIIGALFFELDLTPKLILWSIPLGILYGVSGIIYFSVLKKKDVEIVIPYTQSVSILLIFIGSIIVFNEAVTGFNWLGVMLIIAGVYTVLSKDGLHIPKIDKAIHMTLTLIILHTVFSLLVKKVLFDIKPIDFAIMMYFSSAIFLLAFVLLTKRKRSIDVKSYKIIVSALFGAMGTFLLFSALAIGNASKVFPIAGLQAVFVFIIASIFLKEKFTWHRIIGTIIAVAGIYLVSI